MTTVPIETLNLCCADGSNYREYLLTAWWCEIDDGAEVWKAERIGLVTQVKKTDLLRTGHQTMEEDELNIRLNLRKGETERNLRRMIGSIDGAIIVDDKEPGVVDLLVYELSHDGDNELTEIQTLINQGAVEEVFLISEQLDPTILLKAMRMGIKEVVSSPMNEDEVNAALLRCKERREQLKSHGSGSTGKIIYVIGSKGGVGTTTVAVNTALGLQRSNPTESVVLVDMNTLFGEIPLFLGMRPRHHWGDLARNVHRMDRDYLKTSLNSHSSGIKVLAAPSAFRSEDVNTGDVIQVFTMMRRMFAYVVIDGGQQLGDISSSLLEMADQILVISALSLPCLANTNRILESCYDLGCLHKDRVRILINRYLKKGEISLKDAEESLKMKVFWSIPNDYSTAVAAINRGQAVVEVAQGTALARSLTELALLVGGRDPKEATKGKGVRKGWGGRRPRGPAHNEE